MSDKKISELSSAAALTGSEPIATVQGGVTVQTTAQDIADLAGGGSSLIPNGVKFIAESRELQADDAGFSLTLLPPAEGEPPIVLTIPVPSPLQAGESFLVFNLNTENKIIYEGSNVLSAVKEFILFTTTISPNEGNPNVSGFVSTVIVEGEGGQPNKTALRYLMDKVGNTGTATLVAGTATVTDTKVKTGAKIFVSVDTPGGTQGFLSAPVASIVDETSFVINSSSATETSTVNYWFVNP